MMIPTSISLAGVLVAFRPKARGRGPQRKIEDACTHLPVEISSPSDTIGSPRLSAPLAVPFSNVTDLEDARHDTSRTRQKQALTSQLYWENLETLKEASTRDFVRWLRRNDVSAPVSQRELWALYIEYAEFANRKPLSERRLLNGLKKNGVESFRPSAKIVEGKLSRPTMYRLKASKRRAA